MFLKILCFSILSVRFLQFLHSFSDSSLAAAVEELPEELITLILSKLPVKSLMRFKCVQRSWYSLIKSPHFIHLHRFSSSSSDHCFLVKRKNKEQEQDVLSLHSYETLDVLGNDEIKIPSSNRAGFSLSGSCDGLVCITIHIEQLILICNPATRELRSLSAPLHAGRLEYISSVAFGSDPNTGQYTVMLIGFHFNGVRFARLYDFSTDTWRESDVIFPPGPFNYLSRAISFNGAFHWCPWDDRGSIFTFHIRNEVTGSIPMPGFVHFSHEKELTMCVSSKSQLSLILCDNYLGGRFEIWVMIEYGVHESWTRLFNIGPLSNILRPLAFWDEQQVLLTTEGKQLVSYDFQHKNLRYFPISGDFDLYPYSPSLVSVNGI